MESLKPVEAYIKLRTQRDEAVAGIVKLYREYGKEDARHMPEYRGYQKEERLRIALMDQLTAKWPDLLKQVEEEDGKRKAQEEARQAEAWKKMFERMEEDSKLMSTPDDQLTPDQQVEKQRLMEDEEHRKVLKKLAPKPWYGPYRDDDSDDD